jgi:hypothetical protein
MQIRLRDLEPGLLRRVEQSPRAHDLVLPPAVAPRRRASAARPPITLGRVALGVLMTFGFWLAGLIALMILLAAKVPDSIFAFSMLLLFAASPTLAGYWVRNGWRPPALVEPADPVAAEQTAEDKRREALLSRPMTPETLRLLFEILDPRGDDAVYARCVMHLVALVREGRMPEAQARDILTQANGLVQSGRELLSKLEGVERAVGEDEDVPKIAEMEKQRETLEGRLRGSGASDDGVRRATEKSLAMLLTRLHSARDMARLGERLEAQRDAVSQTLATLESSLARMEIAPDVNDGLEMDALQSTVTDLNRQTRSTERAVEEVVRLTGRAG